MLINLFIYICISLIIASVSDFYVLVMRNHVEYFNVNGAVIGNAVMHYFHNILPFLFVLYVIYCTGAAHYMKRSVYIALSLPALVLTVMLVVPSLQVQLYQIYPDGTYLHGPLYWFFFAMTVLYLTAVVVLLVHYRRTLGHTGIMLAAILIAGTTMMYLGSKHPYLHASNFVISLFALFAYYQVESQADVKDPETGLHDAASFERDTRILFVKNMESTVITIKMQNLNYDRVAYGVKNINALLKGIGSWILALTNVNLDAYYIGNGHIVLILYGNRKKEGMELAEKIRERFSRSWDTGMLDLYMPSEVWLAYLPEHIKSQEQLILSVEEPTDPSNRKGDVLIANEFSAQQRRLAVNHAIAEGIANHRFRVYFQPIYDTKTHTIRTAEALVRLTDPDLGCISPEEFIKIAEQDGYISTIGLFVFEETCRFYTEHGLDRKGISFIEVNLSAVQCMDEHLADNFERILKKYRLDASHIDLEITESAFVHNRDVMQKTIEKLKKLGFTFALDDFGTGFSNYDYLIRFPLSLIKIDKSILWEAEKSEEGSQILRHIVEMCRDMKRGIVTEGVETNEQKERLIDLGVDYLQGFLYSRPIPEKDFLVFIEAMNGTSEKASA